MSTSIYLGLTASSVGCSSVTALFSSIIYESSMIRLIVFLLHISSTSSAADTSMSCLLLSWCGKFLQLVYIDNQAHIHEMT